MQSLSLQVVASMVLWRQTYFWCLHDTKVYYHFSAALTLGSQALLMFMGQGQLGHVQDSAKTCFSPLCYHHLWVQSASRDAEGAAGVSCVWGG